MATEPVPADTTMWTSLLHAGLAGSFMRLPHVAADAPSLEATPATSLMAGRIAVEAMAFHGGAGR
jgi:hypothetical protein